MDHEAQAASCTLRALAGSDGRVRIVTRNLSFEAEKQLGLDTRAAYPAALDLLVGALAADVWLGLRRQAARAGVRLYDGELRLEAHLGNPLAALGVIGESGSPAIARVTGQLFVSTDADAATLDSLWQHALAHAPVYATLARSAEIDITLRPVL